MADNGRPTFKQVVFMNPFATMPPGFGQAGVAVSVAPPATPTGLVLAAQLRIGTEQVMALLAPTPIYVVLVPSAPLSTTASYAVDVQWVPAGTDPSTVNWGNTAATATAPVVSGYVELLSGQLDIGVLRLAFSLGLTGTAPTGANLMIFDDRKRSVGFTMIEGSTGDIDFAPQPGRTYAAYVQAVMPIAGANMGTFAAPYTMGPTSPPIPLPVAAPTVTSVGYDGETVSVAWQAPPALPNAGPLTYEAVAWSPTGGQVRAAAGPTGGTLALGTGRGEQWTTAGRASQGRIAGLAGAPITVLSAVPTITDVAIVDGSVEATVSVPAGTTVRGWVRAGTADVTAPVDAVAGRLTIPIDPTGATGLSVVAQAYQAATTAPVAPATSGPVGPSAPILGRAPRLTGVALATDPTDATRWAITAVWDEADDTQVNGYELALVTGSTTVASSTAGPTLAVDKASIDATRAYVVTLTARSIHGSRSPAATQAVLFTGPLLAGTEVREKAITARWTAPTHVGAVTDVGYVPVVHDAASGAEIWRSAPVSGLAVSIPLDAVPLAPGQACTVGLLVAAGTLLFDAGSDGTAATRAPVQLDAPHTLVSTADPVSGQVTLTWTGIGATYRVLVGEATTPVTVSTASLALPATVANRPLSVRIAADTSKDQVAAAGAYAGPWPVSTGQAGPVEVAFDGTELTASWAPVAGASGYVVSVLKTGDPTPVATAAVPATATSVTFTPGLADTTATYTVVVQAASDADRGLPSPAVALFAPGFVPSRVPASTASPYVVPATTLAQATAPTLGTSGPDITVFLGDLGGGTPLTGLPVQMGPFTLAASGDLPRPYRLAIAGTGPAWTFGAVPVRPDLAAAYGAFLKAAEVAGVGPWGIGQLQEAIARAMPQTFQELLTYAYGLAFPGVGVTYGTVDLRPGMVLRIISSDYMNPGSASTSSYLTGYTGTTVSDHEIGSYHGPTGWTVGFDAFVSHLVANGALSVDPPIFDHDGPDEGGLASVADLAYPGFCQPFYRLFVPTALLAATATGKYAGSAAPSANFTLAAAPSYTALTTSVNVRTTGSTVAYFRGRAVLEVLIRVRFDGTDVLVPVGTTVGNLLDRLGARPGSVAAPLTGLELTRSLGPVAFSAAAPLDAGLRWPVHLGWQGLPVYGPAWDALSMPLLHGDAVTLAG